MILNLEEVKRWRSDCESKIKSYESSLKVLHLTEKDSPAVRIIEREISREKIMIKTYNEMISVEEMGINTL